MLVGKRNAGLLEVASESLEVSRVCGAVGQRHVRGEERVRRACGSSFKPLVARYCAGQQDFVVASNDQQKALRGRS